MAKTSQRQITARDREILESLLRDPKTPDQLLRESSVFANPFRTRVRLQVRLKQLTDAGLLHRWRYLDAGEGAAPYYYKLAPEGFRIAAGPDADPPTKRYFAQISPSFQRHHRALADCNIHMLLAARQASVDVTEFHPQDSVTLSTGNDRLLPDATWQLVPADGRIHNFCFEIDCSTESLTSKSGRANTLEQKIRRYEAVHYDGAEPFRAVFFFTQSRERMHHFLRLARELVRNRHRIIFYAIHLPNFLASRDPLHAAIFRDQNGIRASLIRTSDKTPQLLAGSKQQVYSQGLRR